MSNACARAVVLVLLTVAWFAAISGPPVISPCRAESIDTGGDNAWTLSAAANVATVIATFAALAGLLFAYYQLRTSVEGSRRESHASLLLQLDERWEGVDLQKPREWLKELAIEAQRRGVEIGDVPQFMHDRLTELTAGAAADPNRDPEGIEKYLGIMKICGFFETVGLMCRKSYTETGDIINLLYGSIIGTDNLVRLHIMHLRQPPGSPTAFDNFIYLAEAARQSPPRGYLDGV